MSRRATIQRTAAVLSTLALIPSITLACPEPIEYALDDGSGTNTIGPSQFDANMIWMNSFQAQPGGERLSSIQVSFGDIADNNGNLGSDEIRIGILNDLNNDHDPTDAVLIATASATWTEAGFSEFLEFPIPETLVEGVFYVAIEMDVIQRANPARLDPNAPTSGAQSWLFYHDGQNLGDVSNSLFVLQMSESPFPGAWMIRAQGTPSCQPDIIPDGRLNFLDVSEFLSAYANQQPCADTNNDGFFNFFDISTFLNDFGSGCP